MMQNMLQWLKRRLRVWLGVEALVSDIEAERNARGILANRVSELEIQQTAFVKALKQKAAQPRFIPTTDYEASQLAAMSDFKEKD